MNPVAPSLTLRDPQTKAECAANLLLRCAYSGEWVGLGIHACMQPSSMRPPRNVCCVDVDDCVLQNMEPATEAARRDLSAALLPPERRASLPPPSLSAPVSGRGVPRSTSWDRFARLANHVEVTLIHEDGAPQTIGRTLPEALTSGASLRSTVFNLVSTMLGSGMLSLPWVFAQLGLGGGLTIMLLVPLVGDRTIAFVTAAADRASARQRLRPPPAADKASTQQTRDIQGLFEVSERGAAPNFPEIVEASLGRGPALLAAVSLILLSFAVLVSYVVVVKALLPSQLEWLMHAAGVPPSVPPPSAGWALACVAAVALVPLSSLPSMEQVKYASVASVVLVYGFVLCVCAAGALELHDSPAAYDAFAGADAEWWRGGLADWLRCFPVVCFSFLCHSAQQHHPFELNHSNSVIRVQPFEPKTAPHRSSAALRRSAEAPLLSLLFLSLVRAQ